MHRTETHDSSKKSYIDLTYSIRHSNSKLVKSFPPPLIYLLKKIIYQKTMNSIIDKYRQHQGLDFLDSVLKELNISIKTVGEHNIPNHPSRLIFAANHPFGVVDGLVQVATIGRYFKDVKSIGNELFLNIPNLRPLIAQVNVFGHNRKSVINQLDDIYRSDTQLSHFPAGEVSRMVGSTIVDGEWQKSFIKKAVEYRRDIIPVHILGANSRLFYTVSNLRKMMRIGANIELALLPHELFNKRNSAITYIIGQTISYTKLDSRFSAREWSQKIKAHVYSMVTGDERFAD